MGLWEGDANQGEMYSIVGHHSIMIIITPLVLFSASSKLLEKTQTASLHFNPKNNNIIIAKTFHSGSDSVICVTQHLIFLLSNPVYISPHIIGLSQMKPITKGKNQIYLLYLLDMSVA